MEKNNTDQHWKVLVSLLKKIAEDKNISQNEIAEKTGLHKSNVSRLFKMDYCPTLRTFLAIAQAINVNFFFEDHALISKMEFQASMYWNGRSGYYIPAANYEACLLNSAKMFKLGTLLKQCVFVEENGTFNFPDKDVTPEGLYDIGHYVDMRTVKVQQAKNIRTRPIFHEWSSEFTVLLDTVKMNPSELKKIVENAGSYVGLGDYRPRYGRFEVVKFK